MLSRTVGQKQLEHPSVLSDWTGGDLLWALATRLVLSLSRNFRSCIWGLERRPSLLDFVQFWASLIVRNWPSVIPPYFSVLPVQPRQDYTYLWHQPIQLIGFWYRWVGYGVTQLRSWPRESYPSMMTDGPQMMWLYHRSYLAFALCQQWDASGLSRFGHSYRISENGLSDWKDILSVSPDMPPKRHSWKASITCSDLITYALSS